MINHVTSLELSKKIAELGIEIETELYWVSPAIDWRSGDYYIVGKNYKSTSQCELKDFGYPAPLLTELLTLAPEQVTLKKEKKKFKILSQ